jgi:7-carboxy-7-deazaguanine synthase
VTNLQRPWGNDRDVDGTLIVHSMFATIQGEGPFAGQAALFIRLAGCNLQCPGCDTEYTNKQFQHSPTNILQQIKAWYEPHNLIVITGGEPFRQNITPLVRELLESSEDQRVQIETNGVLYPGDEFPWGHPRLTVVCSPKTTKIHPKTAPLVTAYKYVLSWDSVAPDGLPEIALGHPVMGTVARPPLGWRGPIYLQPMDVKEDWINRRNMQACVDSVLRHKKYILGSQIHKVIGLP